ncbi:MAG: ferritin family protein [Anaerolineales bacterium]|uniref:Ferritin family protein n=1 Tax=Candidatus Desulfolinea nitratireducens TaxID=2841698 RepID=A0A8J6TF40_9CHLR|nr:ferritin family protein [Candidatus Desulfolinea nitratireducens]MBL6960577.1 ferritin family protein [Anaerolineales bacterium]
MDIRKVLEYALQREYEGKAFFENNADRLSNATATGAFKAIAQEEQRHIEFIQAQLDALENKESATQPAPELDEATFFAARADQEMIEQSVSESMVADLPVLRMAYLIEKDFSEFYQQAASKAEGDVKATLEMLARWEAGHERLFKRMHDEAFEKYTEMPWGG